ncbi:DNA-directed RNA polymerase specialized sigma24 family protein [Streptomyces sp. Amel2xB2]|uniref:RNA polymerase sigma factor n=1 Tax=Streptomyces sp. Amel2xB2 TaxID=1305829 RepID=UPI000DC03C23|nr:sigma-70 family RNA polymerase sigma factor [Streptomyces sp. Amel2xB2]RAJ58833.1 DNA-directed RNA polymerase specialized sigma24 family protein [Streptomyces sp. Amel2xB2]
MPGKREASRNSGADRAELTDEPGATTAYDGLFRQHRSAVFSYAVACCCDTKSAEALTSEAFARAVQARRGGGPVLAWRPQLLVFVRRTAAEWAATSRRADLSPDFLQWYEHTVAGGAADGAADEGGMARLEEERVVLRAFRALPERWQTVLWHTAVEEEPDDKVGVLLGILPGSVGQLASRARDGLRESYLTAYDESGPEGSECHHYAALLAAAVRGAGLRDDDLGRHLRECGRCRRAQDELADLDRRLGATLSSGVLLWGGSAYVATRLAEAGTAGGKEKNADAEGSSHAWYRGLRSLSLPAAVLAGSLVAAAGLIVYLIPVTSLSDDEPPGTSLQVVSGPPETVVKDGPTVTSTATPAPSATASGHAPRLPEKPGDFTSLNLRSDQSLGAAQAGTDTVTLAATTGNHDGRPHDPVTFVREGVTAQYRGGTTRFDLSVDSGTTIGNGPQVRISYDLTGNGSWDRVETYRYFESDAAPGFEHYTHTRGLTPGTTGTFGDLAEGRVKVELWDAIGAGASTVRTGKGSFIRIPFS